jgi:hypothetical protein
MRSIGIYIENREPVFRVRYRESDGGGVADPHARLMLGTPGVLLTVAFAHRLVASLLRCFVASLRHPPPGSSPVGQVSA